MISKRYVAGGVSVVTLLLASSAFAADPVPPPADATAPAATAGAPPPVAATTAAPPDATAAAPSAAAVTASATNDEKKEKDFRFGGVINLGLATRPLGIEPMMKYKKMLAVGVGVNLFPGISLDSSSISAWQLELDLRFLPASGSFFVGAGVGYQSLSATAGTVEADLSSLFVTPRLGWLWVWDAGFTLGFDLGANIPIGATASFKGAGSGGDVKNVSDASDLIGHQILPDIKLRIGWMF